MGITGEDTENRRADVAIAAVGSLADMQAWNDALLAKLAGRVSDELSDGNTLAYINNGVRRNYRPERMVRLMDQMEAAVSRELGYIANRDLRAALRYTFPLTHVDEPLIVIVKNVDPRRAVNAYRYDGIAWAPRIVRVFGDDRAVMEDRPGLYVFSWAK